LEIQRYQLDKTWINRPGPRLAKGPIWDAAITALSVSEGTNSKPYEQTLVLAFLHKGSEIVISFPVEPPTRFLVVNPK
jgi:hypothetical protein